MSQIVKRSAVPKWLALTIATLTAITLGITVLSVTWAHVLNIANVQAKSEAAIVHEDLESKIDSTGKMVIDELKEQRTLTGAQQTELLRAIHELTKEVKNR